MLALVKTSDESVVNVYADPNVRVDLPETDAQISPLVSGWEGKGYIIVDVTLDTIANGNYQTGKSTFAYDNKTNVVIETIPQEVIPAAKIADEQRIDNIKNDNGTQALITLLKGSTVAQINTWLTTNVTTLAQARTVLAYILSYMASRM
jgi:hypothetical protein